MRSLRGSFVWLGCVTFAALLSGCSDDSSESNGEVCNDLVNDGPSVTLAAVGTPAPAAVGGTIADGTYELSSLTLYGLTSAPSLVASAVFEIAGNTMEQVGEINGEVSRYTSTFTISGTTVTTSDTCPEPATGSHAFSASANGFSVYDPASGGTVEQAFTKR